MEQLRLTPTPHLAGTIKLPGSKSISNRTLLLAALSSGSTLVRDLLDSDDIRHMLAALGLLGVQVEQIGDSRDFRVQGVGGEFPVKSADLFLGNAGTAFRPLTAALALMQGHYQLSGVARMHERPIGDLVDALRIAGADISYQGQPGYPPLTIRPASLRAGEVIPVKGNVSSQFLTAL
jgi:3-phosphoshikimate 1-carboxyvinyltransferase